MTRLNGQSLPALRGVPALDLFDYDRAAQKTGIVHFGIGAFHRAHQAWYTDRAMDAGERDWMILGVSLRSPNVRDQLGPQDGLYSLTSRSGSGAQSRVIGAVREVLLARPDTGRIVEAIASPDCRIVSFTVTEKGYCRRADGTLDPDLAADGFYPVLREALARRRDAGLPGLTLLSCDNLADNGVQLRRLMAGFLDASDPELARWFDSECSCPSTMVDRIVPATTEDDRTAACALLRGVRDEGAVFTEPFSQWVIEDDFANGRPVWEKVGAQLVCDVAPYETAKLRMLNGAHSALAYLGLARGHSYVHQAMTDPHIRPLVTQLMREEAAPTIAAAPGLGLMAYAEALVARFENPALQHRLAQIAVDGSQKIPQRWLATLADNRTQGRDCPAILAAIAGWLRHVRGDNGPVDDPMAAQLAAVWTQAGSEGVVDALFGEGGLLASDWLPGDGDRRAIAEDLA